MTNHWHTCIHPAQMCSAVLVRACINALCSMLACTSTHVLVHAEVLARAVMQALMTCQHCILLQLLKQNMSDPIKCTDAWTCGFHQKDLSCICAMEADIGDVSMAKHLSSCIIAFKQIAHAENKLGIEQLHLNAVGMQCKATTMHRVVI
jgi:hypothetical protein